MNQLQIAQQIKYLLQTRYWAGDASNSRVFGKVVISAFSLRDILSRGPVLPLAVVRVGSEVNDDDFPELILDAGISVDIVTRVMTDEFGESSIIGGNRASLTASEGRGLGEVVGEALGAVQFIDPESSLTLFSRVDGAGAVTQLKDRFYKSKSIEITAEGSTAAFYQPARAISNSGNTVAWTNPGGRFDFHAAISGLGIDARGGVVLRYASGSTAPATVSAGSGATLTTVYDETYTHGTDGQGSGTFSYSLFVGYDVTGDGTIDEYSAALSFTGSF